MKRSQGRFGHYLSVAALLFLLTGWAVFLRPLSLGGDATYVVIRGSSMVPAFKNGDLVIARAAATYAVGDALAYRVPSGEVGAGTIVIHRIIGGDGQAGFTLQGDNNSAPDPWHPRLADTVGRAVLTVPGAGQVIAFLHQPATLGGLAAGLVVMSVLARAPKSKAAPPAPADQPLPTKSRSSSTASRATRSRRAQEVEQSARRAVSRPRSA